MTGSLNTVFYQQCSNCIEASIIHSVYCRIPQFVFNQNIDFGNCLIRSLQPVSYVIVWLEVSHSNFPSRITFE